jgi:hypothetical protein
MHKKIKQNSSGLVRILVIQARPEQLESWCSGLT